jgi:CRP/FNR family transcriptional regulator, cyclic AMP receptor protein
MARRDAYLDHLAQVPLFAALSKKDLQRIGKASDEVEVKKGKVLVDQGRMGQEFFLIIEGTASVVRHERVIAELGPGDYFGELALLDKGPRNATVVADSDMTLLVLGQREFTGVLDTVPGLAFKVLTSMARRLREADAKALSQ